MIRILFALVLGVFLTPTSTTAQQAGGGGSQPARSVEPQPLRTGDVIRLGFWLDRDLSGDYSVDERGEAVLPLVGVISAASISPASLKEQVRAAYSRILKDQDVQVVMLRRVRVLGEVRRPGLYHAEMGMDLGDLVALAEGTTDVGDMDRVRLYRSGQVLDEALGHGFEVGARLQSGDQIYVPKQSWFRRNSTAVFGTAASITVALIYRGFSN